MTAPAWSPNAPGRPLIATGRQPLDRSHPTRPRDGQRGLEPSRGRSGPAPFRADETLSVNAWGARYLVSGCLGGASQPERVGTSTLEMVSVPGLGPRAHNRLRLPKAWASTTSDDTELPPTLSAAAVFRAGRSERGGPCVPEVGPGRGRGHTPAGPLRGRSFGGAGSRTRGVAGCLHGDSHAQGSWAEPASGMSGDWEGGPLRWTPRCEEPRLAM